MIRDTFIFTTKRLILVDKQGNGKNRIQINFLKSISRFSIETAGTFDLDAELKIWVSSELQPSIKNNLINLLMYMRFKGVGTSCIKIDSV
jgi:hypothetical protein